MQKLQGFVEGKRTVISDLSGVTTTVKGAYPLATVTVYLAGTATLASIYSDNAAVPTVKGNPFFADVNGGWFFYAADGRYDVNFSGAGVTVPFTLGDFALGTWLGLFNVLDYGADPTGGTDSTAEILAAYVTANATGGLVVWPPGTYVLSGAVTMGAITKPVRTELYGTNINTSNTINIAAGSELIGSGQNPSAYSKITYTGAGNAVVMLGTTDTTEDTYGSKLQRLRISGNGGATQVLLTLSDGCVNSVFEQLCLTNAGLGIFGEAVSNQIAKNVFRQVTCYPTLLQAMVMKATPSGALVGYNEMNSFYDCNFRSTNSPMVVIQGCAAPFARLVGAFQFVDVDISFASGVAMSLTDCVGIYFYGGEMANNTTSAITAVARVRDVDLFGVNVGGNGTDFVDSTGLDAFRTVITTNEIILRSGSGIGPVSVIATTHSGCLAVGRDGTNTTAPLQLNYDSGSDLGLNWRNKAVGGSIWSMGDGIGVAAATFALYDATHTNVAWSVDDTGLMSIPKLYQSLPIHANNAAALAGGLVAGRLYRTGADPDVICVVH